MTNKLAAILLALTAGCATDSDGALHVTGRLADPSQVTHLIATNSSTGERVVVDLKDDGQPDGSFEVALSAGGQWIVTFADANKVGEAMRIATLQTGGLDAFSTKSGGTIDFGTVHFDGTKAHGTVMWESLESAFGLDRAALEQLATRDDLALRYSNPDVDGNGVIDALEGHSYSLDLSGSYRFVTDGKELTVFDLLQPAPSHGSVRYLGTAIMTSIPNAMRMNVDTGTVKFDAPFYGTALGAATPMVPAGVAIGEPHVRFGTLDGARQLGLVANPYREAPSGSYAFDFANGHLRFSDVKAPSASGMMAATDYSVPFVHIRASNPQCSYDCDIVGIDVTWKRLVNNSWETVSQPLDARLDVSSIVHGKRTYSSAQLENGATSVAWQNMSLDKGMIPSDLAYITTADVCYVAVTYTSEIGMKLTAQAQNPSCL